MPDLVIRMHCPLGGVVLVDTDDVRNAGACRRQNFFHIAVESARFTLVLRFPAEWAIRLHDFRRKSVDIIRPGLAGGENPPTRLHATRKSCICMRDWYGKQRH